MASIKRNGKTFCASAVYAAVASAGVVNLEFKTPATGQVRLDRMELFGSAGKTTVEVMEKPTFTTGSTAVPAVNRNRIDGSSITSKCTIKSNPSSISLGTGVSVEKFLFEKSCTNIASRGDDDALVLARNTTYIIQATNGSGGAEDIGIELIWTEEG